MFNGFLKSQGVPQNALFDPQRPSETISNLLDYIARQHLHTKLSTIVYVKPAVSYVRDLFKLGRARGLLQKFNATELSDKLTDTVNLEVRHRAIYISSLSDCVVKSSKLLRASIARTNMCGVYFSIFIRHAIHIRRLVCG